MCQLTNFGASNKEMESKIEIYAKNGAREALSKIFTVGHRSTGPGSKSTDTGPGRFRVFESGHRSNSGAADVIL